MHYAKMNHWAMLTLISTVLAACAAVGPDYKRPENLVPAQFSEVETNAAEMQVITSTWWTLYQDAELNVLMDKALKNNTDIRQAVARVEEFEAYSREIGSGLFPTIDLDSSGKRLRASSIGRMPFPSGAKSLQKDFIVQLGTSFELDFWGKARRARESARAQALSTRYAKDTVALTLTGLVASSYLQIRSLDAQIALSRDSLRSRDESLNLTRQRLQGGIASALDVDQAEVSRANLQAQIAELIRLRTLGEHQLAILTGELDLKLAAGDIKTLPVPPQPPAGLPSSLLEARPDIRQAEQNLVAANAKIGVAKAALFPTITLTANYGGESSDLSNILKSAARFWTGGLSLNLPIFDAGRLRSRVDQASAQQKQVLISYEAAIQSAFREVNDALVNLRQNSERELALNTSQQSAKKAYEISVNRYKSGYSAYLEVLDAERVYNDSALAYVQNRQARLIASVDLFKALGGGWQAQP